MFEGKGGGVVKEQGGDECVGVARCTFPHVFVHFDSIFPCPMLFCYLCCAVAFASLSHGAVRYDLSTLLTLL